MLEVIDRGQISESHPVPLLFVHGAWHAAWCWDANFLDFFAAKGYRAVALSLRGHGNSSTDKPLRACTAADFVEDITAVADSLPTRPVIVGHSMGGLFVQKFLESYTCPAGVLMSSMPPQDFTGCRCRKKFVKLVDDRSRSLDGSGLRKMELQTFFGKSSSAARKRDLGGVAGLIGSGSSQG